MRRTRLAKARARLFGNRGGVGWGGGVASEENGTRGWVGREKRATNSGLCTGASSPANSPKSRVLKDLLFHGYDSLLFGL